MNTADDRIAAAPLPTSRTLRRRSSIPLQLCRFGRINLRDVIADLVHVQLPGLGDQLLQRRRRQRARLCVHGDAVADHHECRDRGDPEPAGQLRLRLGVDLAEYRVLVPA
jgi:hypothetical protein